MKLFLPALPDFNLVSAVCSHGFFVLAPNVWDPTGATLTTTITLNDEQAITITIRAADAGILVEIPGALLSSERSQIRAAVRRMLRLDEDLAEFHARCRASATHAYAAESGFGRLIRSASLFEDIVKVICTCNVTWRQTVAMVDALAGHWGVPATSPSNGARGFPTPNRLARVRESSLKRIARLGYRAPFIQHLARDVTEGRLDLEAIERFDGSTDELCRLLRQIHGVGPYAAGNLAMLLGRYDCLAIDTEMVRLLRILHPGRQWTPAAMRAHYEAWRPYQFLAYWFELWQDYTARHGQPREWQPEQVGRAITTRKAGNI